MIFHKKAGGGSRQISAKLPARRPGEDPWGASRSRQNETVAVTETVRGAPSQAAFSVIADR